MAKQKKKSKHTLVKRYIKLMAVNPDPVNSLALIKNSPDEVIKAVCNAAYNVTNGDVKLNPKQKTYLKKYKNPLSNLIQNQATIKQKRRVLVQKGGAFFLPLLLSAALGTLGSALFS